MRKSPDGRDALRCKLSTGREADRMVSTVSEPGYGRVSEIGYCVTSVTFGPLCGQVSKTPICRAGRRPSVRFLRGELKGISIAARHQRRAGGTLLGSNRRGEKVIRLEPGGLGVCKPAGGHKLELGPEEVRKRYGVDPKQVPDFIALRGDPSDKLSGAAGVGPKRAAQLVRRYGSLNAVLEAGLFGAEAKMLRLYRLIARMNSSAPLPPLDDQTATWGLASRLARSWGLDQLADRLEQA